MVSMHDGDDEAYLRWLADNPEGFVLNSRRTGWERSCSVHRANCAHIRVLRNNDAPGGFTQRTGIKLCGGSIPALLAYLDTISTGRSITVKRCRRCDPIPTDITLERLPEELAPSYSGSGNTISVRINPYERDPLARAVCIAHHGTHCKVCDIDLEERYGAIGDRAVQVHFLRPLSALPNGYTPDPIKDLVPVCPNCHSMLHRGREVPLAIEDLKKIMYRTRMRRNGTRTIGMIME